MTRIAVMFLAMTCFPSLAQAFCFFSEKEVTEEFAESEHVLTGTVVAGRKIPSSKTGWFGEGDVYEIKPITFFKGAVNGNLHVYSEDGSSAFPMKQGGSYLLFVHTLYKGRAVVDNCGNSGLLDESAETITKLELLKEQP